MTKFLLEQNNIGKINYIKCSDRQKSCLNEKCVVYRRNQLINQIIRKRLGLS
ncbi:MAG: hypothetical protein KME60_26880 [Cyanomargarita calcarea GSE-NOS-MK-12-04C]|jgi:hypothetical protein|uniref:Uncharacterized protein n=1 Tax=Cyanomargarita calcarea GSE-NOS-MK-12-04C TaxID=2839659 RepID=A0A951UUT1_9CYAN|nr:hypothetical protein [Cyanomargarita calcarea GSE-NOS-MK-12-04C]